MIRPRRVDAGDGDPRDVLEETLPEARELHRACRARDDAPGRAVIEGELIQHDDPRMRPAPPELRQRLDFHFHRYRRGAVAGGLDRRGDRACGGDVVFLDEDLVEQSHAMVVGAAAAHGVLLRGAQPRHGLARIEDAAAGAGHRLDVGARGGRRTTEQLQEVERGALTTQHRARRPCDLEDDRTGAQRLAIGGVPAELHGGVEAAEGLIDPGDPAQHGRLARDDPAAHALRRRHECRGDIAPADILGEGRLNLVAEIAW